MKIFLILQIRISFSKFSLDNLFLCPVLSFALSTGADDAGKHSKSMAMLLNRGYC